MRYLSILSQDMPPLCIVPPYPQWTRGSTLSSGPNRRWRRSRLWRASARLQPAALPAPVSARWKVLRSFSGAEAGVGEAFGAAGRPPGNGNHGAKRRFSPKNRAPPCPLRVAWKLYSQERDAVWAGLFPPGFAEAHKGFPRQSALPDGKSPPPSGSSA